MPFRDVVVPLVASKTLGYVALSALGMGVYSLLPVWKEHSRFADVNNMPSQFHAALSLVLGCLLVFRTNTAYNRWWEARTLWGALVNASRNAAIKFNQIACVDVADRQQAQQLLVAFPVALQASLTWRD